VTGGRLSAIDLNPPARIDWRSLDKASLFVQVRRQSGSPDVATAAQRQQFARALQRAREDCGLSQRDLATALKVTQASVSQWLLGQSAPRPERVAELERALRVPPDTLARHLGYVPWNDGDRERSMTVAEAAAADPRLGEMEQRILAAVYRELVRDGGTGGQGDAGKP
jgi:transcriptional regulator with XRE-family HTH domain